MAKFYILNGTKIMLSQAAYDYYKNIGANIRPATSADAKKKTYAQGSSYGPGQNNNPPSHSGGNKPANASREQILSIIRGEYGDDIELLHENVLGLGEAMQRAKKHRDTTSQEVKDNKAEHETFWDKFSILHDKHTDQETRISANADAIATHGHDFGSGTNGTTGGCSCDAWDIPCKISCAFEEGMKGLGKLALIGVIALFAFLLIKKRLGL